MLMLLFALLTGADSDVPAPLWPAYTEGQGVMGCELQGGSGLLFAPALRQRNKIAFFQLQAARLCRETGVSCGFGHRHLVAPHLALGFNSFVDYARSNLGTKVVGGSAGAEVLLHQFGLRLNGYLPWQRKGRSGEHATYGADIELAYNLEGVRQRLRGFAGYFNFWGPGFNPIQGPQLRLQAEWDDLFGLCKSRFYLAIEWRSSHLRHNDKIFFVGFRVPLGRFKRGCCPMTSSICRRMGDPVRRAILPVIAGDPLGEER